MLARPMDCSAGCAEIAGPFAIQYEFGLVTMRVKIWPAMLHRRRHDSCVLSPSARDLSGSTSANLYPCRRWPTFADLYFHYACSFAVLYSHYACSTSADLYFHYASRMSAGLYWQHSSAGDPSGQHQSRVTRATPAKYSVTPVPRILPSQSRRAADEVIEPLAIAAMRMSAFGTKRTCQHVCALSALRGKADMAQ